jgi:hypothetical protein
MSGDGAAVNYAPSLPRVLMTLLFMPSSRRKRSLTAAEIDAALRNHGRAARCRSIPRPGSRNTAY